MDVHERIIVQIFPGTIFEYSYVAKGLQNAKRIFQVYFENLENRNVRHTKKQISEARGFMSTFVVTIFYIFQIPNFETTTPVTVYILSHSVKNIELP